MIVFIYNIFILIQENNNYKRLKYKTYNFAINTLFSKKNKSIDFS